jgi:hypothetical protein
VFPAARRQSAAADSGRDVGHQYRLVREEPLPATKTAPSAFTMAPYDWLLTDQDVADVVSFIQTSWGNTGAVAASSKVTALRRPAR